MRKRPPLHLSEGFGVELEYMIVDAQDLSVLPVADEVLRSVAGAYESEVEQGDVAWSNELVLHVIEMKTNGPAPSLDPLGCRFQEHVGRINRLLKPLGGRLMPTGMHPWMDPAEMRLWPHEYSPIYQTYHRIFNCRGHGWANLQAVHLNLPFADDAEFGRLHAAVRLVLPLLPALAASTPVVDGRPSGFLDTRLDVYRTNAARFPSIAGLVVPEPVFTRAQYEREILRPMYADIRPFDPQGTLQHEFLNSRGAIARFERGSIEIRLLDVQECPAADVAVCAAVAGVMRVLCEERFAGFADQPAFGAEPLHDLLLAAIRDADRATVADRGYLALYGFPGEKCTAGELWHHLCETVYRWAPECGPPWARPLDVILHHGPLARRILAALSGDGSAGRLRAVYGRLCECLAQGTVFLGE